MSEYWKSAPRYWCKQCKIFIRDTAFEKTQHEATGKHQGNLKRFLRDIHRDNERQQRDSQRAKDEVERLRQTVSGASGGKSGDDNPPWKSASSASTATPKPQAKPVSLDERKRQMAQLAEMGVAIPEGFRADMALAGEWQTVSERVLNPEDGAGSRATLGVRKRKYDVDEEEEEAKREAERFVSKGWGSATKRYPGAQYDADLDVLLLSTKDNKKAKVPEEEQQDVPLKEEPTKDDDVPVKEEANKSEHESDRPEQVKKEASSIPGPDVKGGPEEAASGVVFKKRKPKVMRK